MAKAKGTTKQAATKQATTTTAPAQGATLTDEQVAEYRTQLQALQAQVAAIKGVLAQHQVHHLVTSTKPNPVALCKQVFLAHHPGTGATRGQVVTKLVGMGVAPNTAKTQYQRWFKLYKQGNTDLLAAIEGLNQPAAQ